MLWSSNPSRSFYVSRSSIPDRVCSDQLFRMQCPVCIVRRIDVNYSHIVANKCKHSIKVIVFSHEGIEHCSVPDRPNEGCKTCDRLRWWTWVESTAKTDHIFPCVIQIKYDIKQTKLSLIMTASVQFQSDSQRESDTKRVTCFYQTLDKGVSTTYLKICGFRIELFTPSPTQSKYSPTPLSLFFLIGFNVRFNIFQIISGRCLFVTEGMITTL